MHQSLGVSLKGMTYLRFGKNKYAILGQTACSWQAVYSDFFWILFMRSVQDTYG